MIHRILSSLSVDAPTNKTYTFFHIIAPFMRPLLWTWEDILTSLNGGCGSQQFGFLNSTFGSKAS